MGRDRDDLRNTPGKNKPKNREQQNGDTGKNTRRIDRTKGGNVADWAGVDAKCIADAIAAVAARGGALRFGYTSDGGAYAIGVYGDGAPYTEYLRPEESINDFLDELRDAWA